jgi:iron complex transport system substrate-binding protein
MSKRIVRLFFVWLLAGTGPAWALRIVSLLPSNTEIIEALGAGDQVVGVTRFEDARPGRTNVGDLVHPNLERIAVLKPDLILAGEWKSTRVVPQLKQMGYAIVEINNPDSIEEIYDSIRVIAKAIGREEAAPGVISAMKRRIEKVRANASKRPRYRTYIEFDYGHWTPGGRDFISDACAAAGADNIFADIQEASAQASVEAVISRNPQVIITLNAKKGTVRAWPGWSSIDAVKKGRILDDLNGDRFTRPSPRLVESIEELDRRLAVWSARD